MTAEEEVKKLADDVLAAALDAKKKRELEEVEFAKWHDQIAKGSCCG